MKQFMVLYHAPMAATEKMANVSPEDAKKGMEPWMAWAEKCGAGLVDMGMPLGNGQKMMPNGSAPSDKNVCGYSILQAEDMEGAKKLLEGHPHLAWTEGCEIEVHEMLPLPGQEA